MASNDQKARNNVIIRYKTKDFRNKNTSSTTNYVTYCLEMNKKEPSDMRDYS